MLTVDSREDQLITEFENLALTFKSENLPIGDIQIDGKKTHILIERKTENDLASSLKEGRYKSQVLRMLKMRTEKKKGKIDLVLIYIIEKSKSSRLKRETRCGVETSLAIKYRIFTLSSASTIETAYIIKNILTKLDIDVNPELEIKKLDFKGGKKSNNRTEVNYNIEQFKGIDSIGVKKSQVLLDKFETIFNLRDELMKNSNIDGTLKEIGMTKKNIENLRKFCNALKDKP